MTRILTLVLLTATSVFSTPLSGDSIGDTDRRGDLGTSVNSTVAPPPRNRSLHTTPSLDGRGDLGASVNSTVALPPRNRSLHVRPSLPRLSKVTKHNYRRGCHVREYKRTFSHPDCLNKTVTLRGCGGGCASYAVPDFVGNSGRLSLSVSCSCCEAERTRLGHVLLFCPRDKVSKIRRVNTEEALSCECRSCSPPTRRWQDSTCTLAVLTGRSDT